MNTGRLRGATLSHEKLTPLEIFKGLPNGRIARTFNVMPASIKYVCQEKAWVDQRVFKHWIAEVRKPFTVEGADKSYLLMDEFTVYLMTTCCNQGIWIRGGIHSRRLYFQTSSDGCGIEQAIQRLCERSL